MLIDSLAAILDFIKAKITPTVLVLTPPPVDPGDAPINMREISKKTAAGFREPNSMVLKPAVRGAITWKREAKIFSLRENPCRDWFHSIIRKERNGRTMRKSVMTHTNLKWRDIFLLLQRIILTKKSMLSLSTKNPKPPRTIKVMIVTFVQISPLKDSKLSPKTEKPALQKAEMA